MRRTLTCFGTVFLVSALVASCGGSPGSELRRLADGDDDVRAAWPWVGLEATPDVTPAADLGSTAAVVWIEDFNEVLTLDTVTEVVDCDDDCVSDVTTWAEARLASERLPVVAGVPRCGSCETAAWLSFVTVAPDGGFAAIEAESVGATIGDVDTAYEVMLSFGRDVRVHDDGGRWRAVDTRVVSDCDPYVVEYTMYSVDASGEREQLAQRETSDNSCA